MGDDLIPKKNDLKSNNEKIFRFNLFNDDNLHNKLNLIFINILLPFLDKMRQGIISKLTVEGKEFNFIILFCLYLLILLLIFFGYWIPLITYLNNLIYKTKKMLSIIPFNILKSQYNNSIFNE